MDSESEQKENATTQERLRFETVEKRPGLTQYVFDKVVIVIDRRERNIKDVPELLFGTYDYDPDQASMDQPDFARKGVDMEYIVRCIKEVVRETGDDTLWFDPYKEDAGSLNEEDRDRRKQARARLFSKYATLEEGPDGWGYFIRLNQ
ncbi:MAG: hypothetical protein RLZZ480_12 [Candidatus Parcubacteria bacterium]|jgi:hypothetical protein